MITHRGTRMVVGRSHTARRVKQLVFPQVLVLAVLNQQRAGAYRLGRGPHLRTSGESWRGTRLRLLSRHVGCRLRVGVERATYIIHPLCRKGAILLQPERSLRGIVGGRLPVIIPVYHWLRG